MMSKRTIPGKVTISRVSDSLHDKEHIEITVKDKNSGGQLFGVKMDLEEFANALTGLSFQKAEIEIMKDGIEKAGLKKELMTVRLPYYSTNDEIFRETMLKEANKHEVDGWKLQQEKYNHHRASNGFYSATLIRYVEVDSYETVY